MRTFGCCLQFQKKPSPKEMKSKFTIFFLLISIFIFSQNDDLYLWRKYESYKKLDTINTFSKDYPTKLIEGSGIIKNKNKRIIGSIGFETEITRNRENRILRIYDSQNYHYKKSRKIPAKTISYLTYLYFDNFGQPDFAKVTMEEILNNQTISSTTEFYDLQKMNFGKPDIEFKEKRIRELLAEYNK